MCARSSISRVLDEAVVELRASHLSSRSVAATIVRFDKRLT